MKRTDTLKTDEETARIVLATILDVSTVNRVQSTAHERHERLLEECGLGNPFQPPLDSSESSASSES